MPIAFVILVFFSVIILVHEAGHFILARKTGVRVEKFALGFGKKIWGFKKGDTEYVINIFPVGGYVKLAGEEGGEKITGAEWELPSKGVFQRFLIFVSGSLFNLISAFIVMSILFMVGATFVPANTNAVGEIIKGYPAESAGLKTGDVIVSIDKKEIKTWNELTDIIHKNAGIPITLMVKRLESEFSVVVTPRLEERKDIFGRDIKMSFIGIAPQIINKKYNPFASFYMGAKMTLLSAAKVYQGIWLIITGQVSFKNVSGPIGIFKVTGQAAKSGLTALLGLFAMININLAVINLLPFPILDGGHVLFLCLEKLRGRPLSKKAQETITQIAFYMLLILFILVSYNDLVRFKK